MDQLSTLILAISLIIIMFGMGLSLTLEDFRRVIYYPRAIVIGLVNQLILLPCIGFVLITVIDVPPAIAIGTILLASCPGGPTSNLITHLAKGDTALSVSLTAIGSFASLLTIPFIVNLGLQTVLGETTEVQLNVVQTIAQVFVIVLIPVIIGMIVKAQKGAFALRMEKPVRTASAIVFTLVLVGVVLSQWELLADAVKQAGTITLLLNVGTMSLGLGTAFLFKLPLKQGVSISIESGIQNGTLAISIATVLLANPAYAIAPAIYSLIMFLTGGVMIFWSNKRIRVNRYID
ncbi:MAG: bile acid:sodium symporter family protein [Cyclobacteriaceae bacterium]